MKTLYKLPLAVLTVLLLAGIGNASSADRYSFNFSVTGKTTNDLGALINASANSAGILREVSVDTGIPTSALAMVYERSSGLVSVVDREFGTNVSTVIRIRPELSVANPNATVTEQFLKVDHTDESNFHGSAVATTRIGRNSTGAETSFKMNGKIFVAIDGTGGDSTEIYSGVFSTGRVFTPRQ